VNVALDIFVVIPRSDNRELDSGLLCVFAEREIVEDSGDFDDIGSGGGSAAVMVARRIMRERRREGVSFIVVLGLILPCEKFSLDQRFGLCLRVGLV